AVNKAIDACSRAGGGTVFVPSGFYTASSIHLKSNVALALDKGALLKAMPNAPEDSSTSLIYAKNLKNVKICGPGTIDAAALKRTAGKAAPEKAIALELCKNVEIRNLNIHKAGRYAITATGCADLLIDNVTVKTDRDGLNLSQCKDVMVANCRIEAVRYEDGRPAGGGDAIKLDTNSQSEKTLKSRNITVRNSFLANGTKNPQFSTEKIASFDNISFENSKIVTIRNPEH
ncbi:MAG: glycosyl hydrolase family 28 protein, partial [Planctomycetota bacterium]